MEKLSKKTEDRKGAEQIQETDVRKRKIINGNESTSMREEEVSVELKPFL